ncbi:beta-N-acetylhexosaminidase [Dysgonomonas sp. 521]|uniref:glycoside hydrolase family 20 protein n=1 Tax=Dysgonomonas sp. 521 TaxID=2302932 RepID=UPI0013D58D02|nr:family 20 glycosylhydrolase [Dysgonomonas sp. 521]NDV96315.1 beta-N-acetylhexosaminidase [Dysgonomonas sp. 521]
MKKTLKAIACFVLTGIFLTGCDTKTPVEANYDVIPLPQSITKTDDTGFTLNGDTKISYPKGDEIQKQTAEFLAEYIKLSTGLTLRVTDEAADENIIVLKADYQADKAESYNMNVNSKQIVINGSDAAGTFYGVQTLRKSIPADASQNIVTFPGIDIKDSPRFGYRGMMLDVGRHMFPAEFVKKYIDILALHNINRFHWHITDDQGWRIEIKEYPELTKTGSQRAQTVIGRNSANYDGKPYGGFYTQDEIKEIVDYARKRFITIIPEVDLPGHMLAALATFPNLGCTGGPYKVSETWGIFDDVLCAGNEETYTFLENVFSEVIELFPSQYIHIGGDECPKTRWKECPKCQAKIRQLGLKGNAKHTKEDMLQSYVMSRVEKFLNSKGRRIIGWDEILDGEVAPNATVMSWRGTEGGIAAARMKHDAIMVPTSYLYFDYYQTDDTKDEPLGIGGYVPVEKVYSFDPVPKELTEEESKYIIGTQANLWTEYIQDSKHVEYMVLPRMAALSEIQWVTPEKKDYEKFLPRLAKLMELYKKLGYNYATHITDIAAKITDEPAKGTIHISLFTYDNAPIYYTLDGSEPTEKSLKYENQLEVNSSTQIRAVAIRKGEKSKEYTASFGFNKATFKDVRLQNEPHKNYIYGGAPVLVNAKKGGGSFSDGEWLGFHKDDFVATVDLKEPVDISNVTIGTFISPGSWVFGATEYSIAVSDNDKDYKQVFDEKYPVLDESNPDDRIVDLVAKFPTEKARYVKVTAKVTNPIPDWHAGKGHPSFVFVDEIIIE